MKVRNSSRLLQALSAIALSLMFVAGCKDNTPDAGQGQAQTQVEDQAPAPVVVPTESGSEGQQVGSQQVGVQTGTQQVGVQTGTQVGQVGSHEQTVGQTQVPVSTPDNTASGVQVTQQTRSTTSVKPKSTSKTPAPVAAVAEPVVAQSQTVVIPAGTTLSGSLKTTVSSDKSHVGDAVSMQVTEAVVVEGRTVVPVGSTVYGTVTHVRAAGRMKGAAELTVRFTELEVVGGVRVPVTCQPLRRVIKGDGKETAAEIGGGAAVGGVLGAAVGGADGAVKGGVLGAAVGTGVAVATKGQQIVLAAGEVVQVTVTTAVTVVQN